MIFLLRYTSSITIDYPSVTTIPSSPHPPSLTILRSLLHHHILPPSLYYAPISITVPPSPYHLSLTILRTRLHHHIRTPSLYHAPSSITTPSLPHYTTYPPLSQCLHHHTLPPSLYYVPASIVRSRCEPIFYRQEAENWQEDFVFQLFLEARERSIEGGS